MSLSLWHRPILYMSIISQGLAHQHGNCYRLLNALEAHKRVMCLCLNWCQSPSPQAPEVQPSWQSQWERHDLPWHSRFSHPDPWPIWEFYWICPCYAQIVSCIWMLALLKEGLQTITIQWPSLLCFMWLVLSILLLSNSSVLCLFALRRLSDHHS